MSQRHIRSNRQSLISASLRHLFDAEHFAGDSTSGCPYQSLDQSYHLIGYAAECARKACLDERWADKAIGHRFAETTEWIVEWVLALDPNAHRYYPLEWSIRYPALENWNVDSRYWSSGTASESETRTLIAQTKAAVIGVVVDLFLDGKWNIERSSL